MPTPAPDLGGASPLWALVLLAIVVGPFVYAIVYGLKHRNSGSPSDIETMETNVDTQILRNTRDMRTRGRGL